MNRRRMMGSHILGDELDAGSLGRRFESLLNGQPVLVEVTPIRGEGELFERSLRRIEVMSSVEHNNLVPVLDAGLDGNSLYLVTPKPERTAERAVASEPQVEAFACVARGLSHLHQNGTLHRDVQLRHIGWYDGVVKLGGFGLSDLLGAGRTCGVGPIGSIPTMAPSIVRGRIATTGSDLYSLGAALQLFITGVAVHPQRPESLVDRIERIASDPPSIHPDLPADVLPVVRRALHADGFDEPRAIEDFSRSLEALHTKELVQ